MRSRDGGNGLAATYRGLVRELEARGHDVLRLERAPRTKRIRSRKVPHELTQTYRSVADLKNRYAPNVRDAHVVIVGPKLLDGADVGTWVTRVARGITAFYDSDTSETLEELAHGDEHKLTPELLPKYDLYLSVTDGPALKKLEQKYRPHMARALNGSPPDRASQLERYVAEAITGQLMA